MQGKSIIKTVPINSKIFMMLGISILVLVAIAIPLIILKKEGNFTISEQYIYTIILLVDLTALASIVICNLQ